METYFVDGCCSLGESNVQGVFQNDLYIGGLLDPQLQHPAFGTHF